MNVLQQLDDMDGGKLFMILVFILLILGLVITPLLKSEEIVFANRSFTIPTETRDGVEMFVYVATKDPVAEMIEPMLREQVRGYINQHLDYTNTNTDQAIGLWNYLQQAQSEFQPKRVTFWKSSHGRGHELDKFKGFFACELPRGCYKE